MIYDPYWGGESDPEPSHDFENFRKVFSSSLPHREDDVGNTPSQFLLQYLEDNVPSTPRFVSSVYAETSSPPFLSSAEAPDAKRAPPNSGYKSKVRVLDRYKVVGFISSGTYGRVYKAVGHNGQSGEFAIKKFGFFFMSTKRKC